MASEKSKRKPLTAIERKFVAEYLLDFNATGSLMRCGWSAKSAACHATAFMRRPHVRAAIDQGMRRLETHNVIGAVRVLEEVVRIATADPRKVMNEDGTMKGLHELDEDTARAVSSIKVTSKAGRDGDPPTITHELKFWDKGRANDTLLKSMGKLIDSVTNNTTVVNAGPGAVDEARMVELENKLRGLMGLPEVEESEILKKGSVAPSEVEAEADDVIEAAQPLDDDLDDAFL